MPFGQPETSPAGKFLAYHPKNVAKSFILKYNCFAAVTNRLRCKNKKHILHLGVSIGLASFANTMD
jgi:hypothetical protein